MKLHEALSKSNKVRRSCWYRGLYFDYELGEFIFDGIKDERMRMHSYEFQADDWEPIFEKKTVKKKLYQALFYNKNNEKYFIPDSLFESPEQAKKYAVTYLGIKLVRFLVENLIEVEVEDV